MENLNGETAEKPKRRLNKTVIDNFTSLTHSQESIRLKGGLNLLRHLTSGENSEKKDELKYALGRIIRGLGSSTNNARTGFFTALVALLNSKNEITVGDIFEHIQKHLHKAGSNTKSENADISSGIILTCGAIIRSNLWESSSNDDKFKVLESVVKSSKERSYLGLIAYKFIIEAIDKVNEKDFQKIFPLLKDEISKPWSEQNLDTLYLLYGVKNKYPNLISKKFLKKTIGTEGVVCAESLEKLSNVLMTIPRSTSMQHFVYEFVGEELAASDSLTDFVEELDKNLDCPNRNKQMLVATFLTLILKKLQNPSHIPNLLTKNFVQQTLNFFKTLKGKNQDPEFQRIMQNFFDQMLVALKGDQVKSKTKIAVLKRLLLSPGTFIFEKITRSKIIQHITLILDGDGVKNLASIYRGVITGTEIIDSQYGHSDNWLNNDKLYAAHLLIKLLSHAAVKEANDWKVEQLVFLMDLAVFKNDNGTYVGAELAASLKTAFFGALDLKLSKLEDLQNILIQLVQHLDSKMNAENLETILRNPISVEEYAIWQKTTQIIAKISAKLEKKKKKVGLKSVFLTLFLHMGLQLFNDAKLATDTVNELFICYQKSKKKRHNSQSMDDTNVEEQADEEHDLHWIEVVVDLILNLLSHNSHLLRSIIKSVFPHLCQYMTPATIHQLLSVIDPKNEDNPLSKSDGESSEDDEEDEKEEEDEDESEEEEEEEGNDDEEEDETVNDKLRIALHKALVSNGYRSDEESVDLDQMSETEGEQLDKALADAFRQFKPNHGRRKKQTKDQETLTHFRIRVLDLIEIYLESVPSMLVTLEIMLPLLQAVEFCIRDVHQTPLLNRLKSCLKTLTNLKKFSDTEGVDEKILQDLLKSLLQKGTKTAWVIQDMGVQVADCCVLIVRCSNLLISAEDTPKKTKKRLKSSIADVITKELDVYMHQRDCLTPLVLFKNILRQSWDGSLGLVTALLQYIFDDTIKSFKKSQTFVLLKLFYTNQRYLSSNLDKIKLALSDHHASFSDNVLTFFKSLCEHPESRKVKEKFVCNLFDLLSVLKTSCLNIDNVKWQAISEVVREYRSSVTLSKEAKVAFNKLCNRLGVSNIVKMKPRPVDLNVESDNEEEEGEKLVNGEKKKKKKSRDKEKLRLKKEAKELRLKSLSQGFSDVDFTTEVDLQAAEMEADALEDMSDESQQRNGAIAEKGGKKKKRKTSESESGTLVDEEMQQKYKNNKDSFDKSNSPKKKIRKN